MIRVAVYNLDELMGKVVCTEKGLSFEDCTDTFKVFINELKKGEDYASDREFVRDLPERLASYIHARIEIDE